VWAKTTFAPEEIHLDLDLARIDSQGPTAHPVPPEIVAESAAP